MNETMAVLEKVQVEAPKPFEIPESVQREITVCEQSKVKLGFSNSLSVEAKKWIGQKKGAQLSQILFDLGVPVYSPQSVQEYKRRMQEPEDKRWNKVIIRNLILAILGGMLFGVGCDVLLIVGGGPTVIDLVAIFIIMGTFSSFCCWALLDCLSKPHKTWQWSALKWYRDRVPPQALALALAVQGKMPGVSFRVEYFAAQESISDPFLIASAGDCEHYIAVWDEKGFKE